MVAWRQQRDSNLAKLLNSSSQKKKRSKVKDAVEHPNDDDALIEGINAWMRGWRDIEEGFRIMAQERRLRREAKRKEDCEDKTPHISEEV